jgi:superfamily II DNA or RNA helicase
MDAIEKALKELQGPADGSLRIEKFTGQQNLNDRRDILKRFQERKIDVLIGSQPICTGVDGLQGVCNGAKRRGYRASPSRCSVYKNGDD